MKRGRWEVKSSTRAVGDEYVREFWWVYVAPNGETVCTSEMYTSEAAARKGIASVKRGVLNPVVPVWCE